MTGSLRLAIGGTAALVVFLASMPLASAQPRRERREELQRARQLFGEGVELMDAENYEQAAQRFRAVLEVSASAQVRYNLALALSHTGKLAEANALLRDVVRDQALPRGTRRDARELLDELRPRLARLTVHAQRGEGYSVSVDGHEVDLERVGNPLLIDPGSHQIVLKHYERTIATRRVRIAEGETAEVRISAPLPRATLDGERGNNPLHPGTQNVAEQWWFWAVVGAAALVLLAIVIGVAAS